MRNLSLIIILALSILVISCSKDEPQTTVVNLGKTSMVANINGTPWEAINTECILSKSGITINGVGQGIPAVSFIITDTTPGTHMLNINSQNIGFLVDGYIQYTTFDDAFAHGSIVFSTINLVDSVISGRFDFIGHSQLNNTYASVTEGVFINLPLTVDLDNLSDSLIVDIDGETFFAQNVNAEVLNNTLSITGTDEDNLQTVIIRLPVETPVGTYQFTELGSYNGTYTTDSVWASQSGVLNVTKNNIANKHIEGTFEFIASEFHTGDIKDLKNGIFSVDYY